jgi:hypothetical protein
MVVAFTGTQNGMTETQRDAVRGVLRSVKKWDSIFLYGACVGADSQAMLEALALGFQIVAYPANNVSASKHGLIPTIAVEREAEPALARNRRMVSEAELLLAAPHGREQLRSGTWATVRYARRCNLPIVICWPNGLIRKENDDKSAEPDSELKEAGGESADAA